ncbi:hypothetical protein [Tenacibaculum maritimum]|uniref:hypothetical protein n=1 Tax=Tenacibaculum maritimum TaxID=107401 RepID=UPI00132FD0FD|nr:hypothetical protein [Tenacibaculum maritimum]MCD9564038.1 hypothetical protein [Tenacibaculum maritimum]MCD9564385.1 hypothetical protein [Tenacibaculum maritimum]MCD9578263.1 hypothetical protein [Tenacibaculum maritimum]MCD9598043.1 hypothetical protein [Tenacibaculum maritimum]MCD9615065.1 hypothetical protein [Tenacibaculum maritimum]
MMKNLILTISILFVILTPFQSIIGQSSSTLKGKITDYNTNEYLVGVKIETYNGKILLRKTETNLEDGSFTLSTKNTTNKIIISYNYYYPIIIENISKIEENVLNLGIIKLVEIPIVFTRYVSKKAERKGRKEEKRKLKTLKEGIIISSSNRNYKMRLKKRKGEFGFYIDFKDFQNN